MRGKLGFMGGGGFIFYQIFEVIWINSISDLISGGLVSSPTPNQQMFQPLVSHDAQDNRRGQDSAKEREPQSRGRACPGPGATVFF